jgi:predicted HD phosphohydrolase
MSQKFISLETASAADWAAINAAFEQRCANENAGLGLLRLLEMQEPDDRDEWPINVYQHSLQSATRAIRAGEDDLTVFCALFHDVTEILTPFDHGGGAARILEPYLTPDHVWMVEHHAIFQNRHALEHPTRNRSAYLKFQGHPAFERTIDFCRLYDENSFDPNYDTMPITAFYGLVDRVCRAAF